jgi:glutathione peroxidase
MKSRKLGWIIGLSVLFAAQHSATAGDVKGKTKVTSLYDIKMKSLAGKDVDFAKYKGKVVLIVNVASECGYTPQYKGLQDLHKKYADKGLVVLGVPSNDFGKQEPGTEAQIADFCQKNYGVTFDMFSKVGVISGKSQSPLYQFLTSKKTNPNHAGEVEWNFEKFIIGVDGSIIARLKSDTEPDSEKLRKLLEEALTKKK